MTVPGPLFASLLVAAGGAAGAVARYQLGRALGASGGFPWATLGANLIGSLAMGLLVGWLARHDAGQGWRLLLGVGLLGGFTTFSAFSLDIWTMWERGAFGAAFAYALVSVLAGVGALFVGLTIMRVNA